jgi:hypothetical protein
MQAIYDIDPSKGRKQIIESLYHPLDLRYEGDLFCRHGDQTLSFEITFLVRDNRFKMVMNYDEGSHHFYRFKYIDANDEETIRELDEKYPREHPYIEAICARKLQLIEQFKTLSREPITKVTKTEQGYVFKLQNCDSEFWYEQDRDWLWEKEKDSHYDRNEKTEYLFYKTDIIERLKAHPSVRLHLLFQ